MGDLFWNKIFGAVLGTLLFVFGLNEVSHALYHPHIPHEPAYVIQVAEGPVTPPVDAGPFDLGVALRAASASAGERQARKCAACHTFEQGGGVLQGPNLWGVVGRPVASVDGFSYSAAMREHGGDWTYEALWTFLENPRNAISGTAMSFAGLRKEDERADLIAYLQTLSASPVPFPEPLAAAETSATASDAVDAVVEEAQGAGDAISGVASDVADTTTETAGAVADAAAGVADDAASTVENAADAVADVGEDAADAVEDATTADDVNGEPSDE